MKHKLPILFILISIFLAAQVLGLFITKHYLTEDLPFKIEKPEIREETSFIPLFIIIIIATVLALLLIRLQWLKLWKLWFFASVTFCLLLAFNVVFNQNIALVLALTLAFFKIVRPSIIVHNFTELFIYGGLAAIFVPVFNIFSIFILLIIISVYDMIAVWKTKHMIKLAKFQAKSKVFAGLLIPYTLPFRKGKTKKKVKIRTAVLGGGDIGFPLLFAGVIMKNFGFLKALVIPIFAATALFLLFMYAKKKKFYPAMPFVTAGCLLGYLIVLVL